MSPEPTQEPLEQDLKAPNVSMDMRAANDSDSEDEDAGAAGYLPLSQVPTDSDVILDDDDDEDEDDEWVSATPNEIFPAPEIDTSQEPPSELVEVWANPSTTTNIDLDAEKISQVKSMMASFTLPTTAIPDWANAVSEDQWKDQLINRIKKIQEKE